MAYEQIGQQFLLYYYSKFDSEDSRITQLEPLYAADSYLSFEGQCFSNKKTILEKYASLPIKSIVRRVTKVDCQPLSADQSSILVTNFGELRVMPGMHSFVGGSVDERADFNSYWATTYLRDFFGLAPTLWTNYLAELESGINRIAAFKAYKSDEGEVMKQSFADQHTSKRIWTPAEWAFKIAALRELFEECGILVSWSKNSPSGKIQILNMAEAKEEELENLERDRKLVHENAANFVTICEKRQILPAFWLLREWSNWLTPCNYSARARFDSVFYVLALRKRMEMTWFDRAELEEANWFAPARVCSWSQNHGMKLAPPQVYEMARVANFDTWFELDLFAANRQRFGMVQFCPILARCSDAVSLAILPGDDLYPTDTDVTLCDMPVRKFEATSEYLRSSAVNLHRIEYPFTNEGVVWTSGTLYIDITQPCKHIGPVEVVN